MKLMRGRKPERSSEKKVRNVVVVVVVKKRRWGEAHLFSFAGKKDESRGKEPTSETKMDTSRAEVIFFFTGVVSRLTKREFYL